MIFDRTYLVNFAAAVENVFDDLRKAAPNAFVVPFWTSVR